MGIAEIIAKKKAEAEAAALQKKEEPVAALKEQTLPEETKKEEPAIAAPKPLTFAEKMALKKAEASAQQQPTTAPVVVASQSVSAPAPIPVKADTGTPKAEVIATVLQVPDSNEEKLRTGVLDHTLDKNPMPPPDTNADPAIAQAYADIKYKIDALGEKTDMDLEGAMKDLKKALMANPAAVSLMEDTDIGKMVIALRRITGEAIAEAATAKTPGRKPRTKNVDLSDATAVAAIFDEL